MSDKPLALATVSPAPAPSADYDAICATVMASARGRWFLQEHARRNRSADTRLVLAAIARIEALIRGQQTHQDLRVEMLDMAKTIAITRAEIAEIAHGADRKDAAAAGTASTPDVFAAVERVQEVAWTMRERGFHSAICDQIETLATSILSNASLRDPNDRRARKLGEVLHYLGCRIEGMLEGTASTTAAAVVATEPAPSPAGGAAPAERALGQIMTIQPDPRPLPARPLAPPHAETSAVDVAAEIDEDLFAAGPVETAAQPGATSPAEAAVAPAATAWKETPAAAAQATAAADSNAGSLLPAPTADPASNDLMAALQAMSDEERIALFT